jgi:hypothetical protein
MGKMGLPTTECFPSAQWPQPGRVLPMSAQYSRPTCLLGEFLRVTETFWKAGQNRMSVTGALVPGLPTSWNGLTCKE